MVLDIGRHSSEWFDAEKLLLYKIRAALQLTMNISALFQKLKSKCSYLQNAATLHGKFNLKNKRNKFSTYHTHGPHSIKYSAPYNNEECEKNS